MMDYKIQDKYSYEKAMQRIEELEGMVCEDTPKTDPAYIELDALVEAVDKYENVAYPIAKPSFAEVMKLRMYEMGLNKRQLSELLGISVSSVNSYLSGSREPSLPTARRISRDLHISSDIVLGV